MTEQERYSALEQEKQNALNNSNKTYEDLLTQNQQYSNSVNDYLNKYQTTQNDIYDKQIQFQVDLQNQNKEKAEKEYQKEAIASKNAYYDFINPYGVQAEIQAQNGLNRTGYSETVKSQAWTTQQNRTAQARASMNEAKLQFDNAIKEAYLNNDVNKANLALQILQQQQEETLRNFNYISDTKQNQLSTSLNLDSEYNNRYNTLYSQIQQEKAREEAIRQWEAEMAEKQRQYNESLAYQKEQDRIAQANWEKEYALSQASVKNKNSSGGNNNNSNGGIDIDDNNNTSDKKTIVMKDKNGNTIITDANGNVTVQKNNNSNKYSDTGYSIDANGSTLPILELNGKYYYKNNNKYVDISSQIVQMNSKFMTLKNGTVIAKG